MAATDSTHRSLRGRTVDQLIGEPLVIPLAVVMGDEFSQSPTKVPLAERGERFKHSSFTDRTNRSVCALPVDARAKSARQSSDPRWPGFFNALVPTKTGYVL